MNVMTYNDYEIDEALEALRTNRQQKTVISTKEFNAVINQRLNELKNTPLKTFEAKKDEIIDWAMHNYYKVENKTRTFNEFMSSLRLYIFKLKKEAPRQTLEERKAKAKKELLYLLKKLENAQNDYEFGITENQICNIVDRFDDPKKSEKIRIQLNELRQNWEHKHKNPF